MASYLPFFPFRVDPFQNEGKTILTILSSDSVVPLKVNANICKGDQSG